MYIACSIINFLRRPFCRLKYGQYDIAIAFSGHWNDLHLFHKDMSNQRKLYVGYTELYTNI